MKGIIAYGEWESARGRRPGAAERVAMVCGGKCSAWRCGGGWQVGTGLAARGASVGGDGWMRRAML